MLNIIIKIIMIIFAVFLIFYIISPIDLIPDIIPVVGWIDDIIAAILLIPIAWKIIR